MRERYKKYDEIVWVGLLGAVGGLTRRVIGLLKAIAVIIEIFTGMIFNFE